MVEVDTVLHFFGENVTGVALASNVKNAKDLVLNPFADGVFPEFHVEDALGGSAIGRGDAGLIVVVHSGRAGEVRERDASRGEGSGKVAGGNHKLGTFIGSMNFGFAGAE